MRSVASRVEPFTAADLPILETPSPVPAAESAPAPRPVRSARVVKHLTMMKALASPPWLSAIKLCLDEFAFTATALQTPMRILNSRVTENGAFCGSDIEFEHRPRSFMTKYRRAPLRRRILGSALSSLVGWFTLTLVLIGGTIYEGFRRVRPNPYEWEYCALVSAFGLLFVFGTWVVFLVPLYLLVPLRSVLWRWPICTLCGALASALIMFGVYGFSLREPGTILMVTLAAITGAATCLFGALTASRFCDANHANVP